MGTNTYLLLFALLANLESVFLLGGRTVAKAILDHIFFTWGLCHEIVMDLDQEFQAKLLSELLKLLDVMQLKSSGCRAQTNGCCKVWHRTLDSLFAKVIAENQRDWSTWVPYVTFCYNATMHSSTQFPPFFVYTGRLPLWTVDLILPNNSDNKESVGVVERLDKVNALVTEHLQAAAVSASRCYNKKARPRTLQPGDKVRIFNPRRVTGQSGNRFIVRKARLLKELMTPHIWSTASFGGKQNYSYKDQQAEALNVVSGTVQGDFGCECRCLAEMTLAQVILFNRRRQGEVSKLTLDIYRSYAQCQITPKLSSVCLQSRKNSVTCLHAMKFLATDTEVFRCYSQLI